MELLSEHKQSSKLVALTPIIAISVIGDHPKNGMETHHDWLTLFRKEPPSSGGELFEFYPHFPVIASLYIVTYLTYLKIADFF